MVQEVIHHCDIFSSGGQFGCSVPDFCPKSTHSPPAPFHSLLPDPCIQYLLDSFSAGMFHAVKFIGRQVRLISTCNITGLLFRLPPPSILISVAGYPLSILSYYPFVHIVHRTVESGLIQTVANVVTRMTIPSWAAQPGSLAN